MEPKLPLFESWEGWSGQSTVKLEDLRCPSCGRGVFVTTINNPGEVTCRDMGHWVGPWTECLRS